MITTVFGSNTARPPMRSTCSHAFATTLVGSSRTPSSPSVGSTFTVNSGVIAVALRAVAVVLLDPPLGVLAVSTEIPFAHRAVDAGHRVGSPHDADHQVAHRDPSPGWRLEHTPERLVTEHQAIRVPAGAIRTCPTTISVSVPHTPIAIVSTRTGPSDSGGSATSSSAAEPAFIGVTRERLHPSDLLLFLALLSWAPSFWAGCPPDSRSACFARWRLGGDRNP